MKYIVVFAGPVGSSKTPIANYLSSKFNLPTFNTDAIRSEVTEDFLSFSEDEFIKRRNSRLLSLFEKEDSFILDASIDREWKNYQGELLKSDFKIFTISLDLSRDFLAKLYAAKNYSESLKDIDRFIKDHQNFISQYAPIVNLSINDSNFTDRLSLSEKYLSKWLENNGP
ncbi:hypothetical protein KKD37_01720 [Patescibacteria group bacterium]|nr:hypothetical protein [Patescibacteria group bacterium]